MILLLYMSLLYGNWYTPTIYMFEGVFQYTSLFTVYDSLLIRTSAYTSLRSTLYWAAVDLLIMVTLFVKKKFAIAKVANLD